MRDLSDLHEEAIAAALRDRYGIEAVSIAVVPGGEDPRARAYRVETGPGSSRYFVKVREANGSRDVAAAVCRHLHETGLRRVVAPIRANGGSLTVDDGSLSITVHPFIDGLTGVATGLEPRHWVALGREISRLHATALPPDLSAPLATEDYRPTGVETIRRIDHAVSDQGIADPIALEVAAFWTAHRAEILELVERTEELGELVERLSLPLVLCHADLHTWNVMIDVDGELWLIDWDEVVRAPKERDLMFVVGGISTSLIQPHETEWFFEGYGETAVDPLALSYYRHAWAVQDIGSYGEAALFAPSAGDESRSHAARMLMRLFAPGEIVELARVSYETG